MLATASCIGQLLGRILWNRWTIACWSACTWKIPTCDSEVWLLCRWWMLLSKIMKNTKYACILLNYISSEVLVSFPSINSGLRNHIIYEQKFSDFNILDIEWYVQNFRTFGGLSVRQLVIVDSSIAWKPNFQHALQLWYSMNIKSVMALVMIMVKGALVTITVWTPALGTPDTLNRHYCFHSTYLI